MVKMLTHRMIDNLSCMLQAKDELVQAYNLQAQAAAHEGMEVSAQLENMEDSELARENAQLRRHLLEAAADNDALSKSLQERAQSLSDIMDAKINTESEAKVLQVQMKCMQKDMDVHKYELHLLRKQLQIRNDEREQNKKATDASHKKQLDNVKKIARLESECQRLRGLIRQRLPGPAVIAQMRAECEPHITLTGKKRSPSIPRLPSSSYLQYQKEIEALTERLFSVEDEAKFLKEALAKRTAELQEARQLCARTAMKLSSAQDRVEALSIGSVPSTPQPQKCMPLLRYSDHHQALIDEERGTVCDNYPKDEGMYSSSVIMHAEDMEANIVDVLNSEIESSCNNDEQQLDHELSCAESWASALIAELSHLSNLHGNASVITAERLSVPKDCKPADAKLSLQELEFQTALQKVSQKLSHAGESLQLLSKEQANHDEIASNFDSCATDNTAVLDIEQHVNILEEILETKHLLLELDRDILEMKGKSSLQEVENVDFGSYVNASVNHVNDDVESMYDEEGKNVCKGERILSRLESMEDGDNTIKISAADTKFGGITSTSSTASARMEDIICDGMIKSSAADTNFSGNVDIINAIMENVGDRMIISSFAGTKFSGNTSTSSSAATSVDILGCPLQLNLDGDQISDVASDLAHPALQEEVIAHVPVQVDAHVALESLLLQAELEQSRGKIATLEGDLDRVLREKDDVAKELSDTCSLKENLEAELASSLAMVEELKLQVSSLLKSQLADEGEPSASNTHLNGPTLTQSSTYIGMKEEQDLTAARAQLADCQRSIHVMRKQMAFDVVNSTSQDVIIDELASFDSSSESSKSMDQKSHSTSPTVKGLHNFDKCSSRVINMDTIEHNVITLLQQEDNTSCPTISSNINPLRKSKTSLHTILSNTHVSEDAQSFEKCKVHSFDDNSTSCNLLIKSTSKEHATKQNQLLAKPLKLSTKSRIAGFFNRAKFPTTKEIEV